MRCSCTSFLFFLLLLGIVNLASHSFKATFYNILLGSEEEASGSGQEEEEDHGNNDGTGSDVVANCVSFSVFGTNERYFTEVQQSIQSLKENNPTLTVVLSTTRIMNETTTTTTTTPKMMADKILTLPPEDFNPKTPWLLRTKALLQLQSTCRSILMLDSHVTSCTTGLHETIQKIIQQQPNNFVVGFNYVHDTSPHWSSSPTQSFNMTHKTMPHNFAVLFKSGQESMKLIQHWAKLQEQQVKKDDQKALRRALVDMGMTSSQVPAGLMGAFYPLDRGGLGNFPRITYPMTDQIHLLHSFSPNAIPAAYNQSICHMLNYHRGTRQFFLHPSASAEYIPVTSHSQCHQLLNSTNTTRICDEFWSKQR